MIRITLKVAALSILLGLGCGHGDVRPDEMSAEGHREAAQQDRASAQVAMGEAANPYPPAPLYGVGPNNEPLEQIAGARDEKRNLAVQLREHARQHEAAARELEQFEDAECKQTPASERAACPLLGPVVALVDIPDGISVTFAAGTHVDAALAHMRCHLAFARARGFGAAASCPLYVRGIDIRPGAGPLAIEIVSGDRKTVEEIRLRSREEAVLVRGGRQ